MKLLHEEVENVAVSETSNADGEKEFYLEGIFLQANKKNRNGRIYPLDIMKREVESYKREYIDAKRSFGELGHPSDQTPNINLERVSHLITDIWQDGDYFKARAKILDTPYGKIVKAMIKEGCQLGVSSRALGSVVTKNGVDYVGDDFKLVTAGDIVWEPSAQTAFPKAIMENREWIYDEATQEYIQANKSETEKLLTEMQIKAFEKLLQEA